MRVVASIEVLTSWGSMVLYVLVALGSVRSELWPPIEQVDVPPRPPRGSSELCPIGNGTTRHLFIGFSSRRLEADKKKKKISPFIIQMMKPPHEFDR